jgi:hypothetical protein
MKIRPWLFRFVVAAVVFCITSGANPYLPGGGETLLAYASSPTPQEKTSELEASLFVQDPHFANGKKAVQVIWIPGPVQKYCMGKTAKECSTIDYCIRTTDKHAAMCQHLSADIARLPPYPPNVSPRRVLSVVYFLPMASEKGFDRLAEFFENAPKGSLDHLSRNARIRAKVKLTRSAGDDEFEVLEVLEAPSR